MKEFTQIFKAFFIWFTSSGVSLQKCIYSVLIDEESGDHVLENMPDVKIFLEKILKAPENYVFSLYERVLVVTQKKRTKLRSHGYYLITDQSSGQFYTLSYYGTKIAFRSQGAWIINSNSDIKSYSEFLSGSRKWDVVNIKQNGEINTEQTIKNIFDKINSGITYYYKDHIRKKPGVINCNTAIWETIVLTHES